jgi:hypothetical protein
MEHRLRDVLSALHGGQVTEIVALFAPALLESTAWVGDSRRKPCLSASTFPSFAALGSPAQKVERLWVEGPTTSP